MIENKKEPATEADKFRAFAKQILSVPKAEIDQRETEYKKSRARLKRRPL
jgi:hypothetical protein